MARKKFKCGRCGRAFSMKAHLVRHANTTHRSGSPKRTNPAPAKTRRISVVRGAQMSFRPGETGDGLSRVTAAMEAYRDELICWRVLLDGRIVALDSAMQALRSGSVANASNRNPARKVGASGSKPGSLKSFIVQVLRSHAKPMSPREIAQGVKAAGYKSKAKDLGQAVSNVLSGLRGVNRVGFGMYRA